MQDFDKANPFLVVDKYLAGSLLLFPFWRTKQMIKRFFPLLAALLILSCSSENPVQTPNGQFFIVQVGNERFTMQVTDETTIRQAIENFQGKNHKFPAGRIATGNGGFNSPWSWHFIPETDPMVGVAIEVCDGLPSYVNTHLNDFITVGYCPWSGKIIQVGR